MKLDIDLFSRSISHCLGSSCVRPVVFSIVSRPLQYTRHHSSCLISGKPSHLVLLTLPCLVDVPAGAEGGLGTHDYLWRGVLFFQQMVVVCQPTPGIPCIILSVCSPHLV